MPAWAKRDVAGTRAARKSTLFVDRRSWIGWRKDGSPYIRLYGRDKAAQCERLHLAWDGNCATCNRPVHGRAELDHVRSRGKGGDDSDANQQFLHRRCHKAKHGREIRLRTIRLEASA